MTSSLVQHTDRRAGIGAPALLMGVSRAQRATATIALAAAAALVVGAARAGAQLVVDPLEVVLVPGQATTGTVSVRNEGKAAVQASLKWEDWDRDSTGQNHFYEAGTRKGSCGQLVRVFPEALRLEPNEAGTIRVMLVNADSLREACWSIVFVETRDTPSPAQRQITFAVRTGVKIYVELPSLSREGDVEDMRAEPHLIPAEFGQPAKVDSSSKDAVVLFRNTGGVQLRVRGTLEVRRPDNSVVKKIDLSEHPVLPGARRLMRIPIPRDLPAGRYVLLALLDYGGGDLAAGQLEYEAP